MIKSEFIKFFKSKKTWIVFAIILILAIADSVLAIFVESKPEYIDPSYGQNNPAYFSLISGGYFYSLSIVYFYMMPIFLMIAYCDNYVRERKQGVTLLQYTKQGRKKYFFSKITVAFLFPVIICGVPNLINLFINTVFLYGGTNFSGLQTYTESEIGGLMFWSINHPYTTYFIFLLMNLIVCGLLSIMCQSLCFIFKDNKIVYLLSLVMWIGIYFSSRQIGISYVLQPFLCVRLSPIIYSFIAFLPSALIPLAISYYRVVNKKDEI